jgi:hypothetical protein
MEGAEILRLLSSSKVGLPVASAAFAAIAYGSYLSARYDPALGEAVVYGSPWFSGLLALVGLWALANFLTRRPFSTWDVGLWIGGGGLLVTLLGAGMTRVWSVRGTVDLTSGQRTDQVILDAPAELDVRGASAETVRVERRLRYAERLPTFQSGSPDVSVAAVAFRVETLFGETTRWLDSARSPEMDLGDAHLVLVVEGAAAPTATSKPATLEVRRVEEDAWRSIPLDALATGPVDVDGLRVSLVHVYEQAIVTAAGNGMSEGSAKGMNPALELSIAARGQTLREVLYARFPDFTLSPAGVFGHKLRYSPALAAAPRTGNVVECHVDPGSPGKVRIRLLKLGAELLSQDLRPGETLATPWSGIQLTLMDLVQHAVAAEKVVAVEPHVGQKLPPSAIELLPAGAPPEQAFWLIEGDTRSVPVGGTVVVVRYGPPPWKLPFQVAAKPSVGAVAETAIEITPPGSIVRIRPNAPASVGSYDITLTDRAGVLRFARDPGRWVLSMGWLAMLVGLIALALARKAPA